MPLTQFSGTGFAGIETSLMTEPAGGEARKSGTPGSRRIPRLLNVLNSLPYHFRAGRYQWSKTDHQAAHRRKPGPIGGRVLFMSLNGGLNHASFDLAPFYRSTVGFDRLFDLLDQVEWRRARLSALQHRAYRRECVPYQRRRLWLCPNELSIVAKENTLTIKGEKVANENGKEKSEVLYRGIAARAFERAFQLADYVQVKNASLENGSPHVDLVREIRRPRSPNIPISTSTPAAPAVEKAAA